MKFDVSADWALSSEDKEWLLSSYIPEQWERARFLIQKLSVLDGVSRLDPTTSKVNIVLKHGNWDQFGVKVAGYLDPSKLELVDGLVIQVPTIYINWQREFELPEDNLYGRILRHEFVHLFLYLINDKGWFNSMHGKYEHDKDIFLSAINDFIKDIYPTNHSSFPGLLPI